MLTIRNISWQAYCTEPLLKVPTLVIRILDHISQNNAFTPIEFNRDRFRFTYAKTYNFRFNDTTDENDPYCISEEQGRVLLALLENHILQNPNGYILSHCVMGSCRSGAISAAAAAICQLHELPFNIETGHSKPNALVKSRILQPLWGYA
jgi:predicted protein tyrosine phosphatase